MLVIVMTVKEWRHYLDAPAHRTIVLNEALQSFMTTKQLQGNQTRTAQPVNREPQMVPCDRRRNRCQQRE